MKKSGGGRLKYAVYESTLAFFFAAGPPPLCFPIGEGGPRQRRSGAAVYRPLETIFSALFHPAPALSAPSGHLPLEGKATIREYRYPHIFCLTANEKDFSLSLEMTIRGMRYSPFFQRKEGVSTRAPSLGRGKGRSEAGVASFLRRSRLLFAFPIGEGGPRQRWIGCCRISPA